MSALGTVSAILIKKPDRTEWVCHATRIPGNYLRPMFGDITSFENRGACPASLILHAGGGMIDSMLITRAKRTELTSALRQHDRFGFLDGGQPAHVDRVRERKRPNGALLIWAMTGNPEAAAEESARPAGAGVTEISTVQAA